MKGWYINNRSDCVLIFIHGIFSNSKDCWSSDDGTFWPDLISEDVRFVRPSIFLAEFHTSKNSGSYGINECAKEVMSLIKRQDSEGRDPPISKERIIFVTHSSGGIIARYILDYMRSEFIGKKIGLCLMASPSYGSRVPYLLKLISKIYNHQLVKELCWASDILKDLDERFIELLSSNGLDIVGIEAYENYSPFGVPFIKYRVVEKESAARYFSKRRMIPNTNHSTIVKPLTNKSESHEFLLDFLVSNNMLISDSPISELDISQEISIDFIEEIPKTQISSPSLFLLYSPKYESYFIERNSDIELIRTLSVYSVWVCGESGTGKTCSILRALYKSDFAFKYITLGTYINSNIFEIFQAILIALTDDDEVKVRNIGDCIKKISDFINNKTDFIYIFIEEIPMEDEVMFEEFSRHIFSLITAIKNEECVRFILSSIFSPIANPKTELSKVTEKLKVFEWKLWEYKDIKRLVAIIKGDTNLDLEDDVFLSNITPRQIKEKFKTELTKSEYISEINR